MMLSTEEAAAILTERGVLVKGRGKDLHPPVARTVEAWCRSGALKCEHVGKGRRSTWLVSESALESFEPPKMGRKKSKTEVKNSHIAHNIAHDERKGLTEDNASGD